MIELLTKLLEQLNSSVMVLIVILVITCVVLYKLGYWTHKFAAHDKRVEHVEGLAEKVVVLTTKVDLIYQIVNPHAPLKANSPISLTPTGSDIAKNLNADALVFKYSHALCTEIDKLSPKTAYDIQQVTLEFAKTRMINLLNEEELLKVKQEAFNRGMLLEDVMSVFGILLRNHILQKKGVPIAEVDKHIPSKA